MTAEDFRSRAPWSTEPSLKAKAEEVGVDFDRFIEGLAKNRSDQEIAREFGVTEKTVWHLRNHFEKLGVHSIMGQD